MLGILVLFLILEEVLGLSTLSMLAMGFSYMILIENVNYYLYALGTYIFLSPSITFDLVQIFPGSSIELIPFLVSLFHYLHFHFGVAHSKFGYRLMIIIFVITNIEYLARPRHYPEHQSNEVDVITVFLQVEKLRHRGVNLLFHTIRKWWNQDSILGSLPPVFSYS